MSAQWKGRREAGARWAVLAICALGRHGGRGLARALLYPATLYYLFRRGDERRDSRAYLTRVLGRPPRWRERFRHLLTFSQTILDRIFLLGDTELGRFDVRVDGIERLDRQVDSGQGVLLFGSHLGSFEVLRVLSRRRPDVPLRVVLDRQHSAALTAVLDALNPEVAATVIDAGQDGPSIMFAIQEAIAEGAIVALLVDRTQPGEPSHSVPFLGAPARFPAAPWLIASVLKAPIVLAFGLYRGGNRYDLSFEWFSDGLDLPRRARAQALPALIGRYAARLEDRARSAPYNWFNFYDFWEPGDDRVVHTDSARRAPSPVADGDAVRTASAVGLGAAADRD